MTAGEGLAMEFLKAHEVAELGRDRLPVLRRHGLFDPDWCLVRVTGGYGQGQLERLMRAEFARPGFNCVLEWTVISKSDAQAVIDRFAEIGYADRVALKLLPPKPQQAEARTVVALPFDPEPPKPKFNRRRRFRP
ncbi:hypothetical protein ACFXPT_16750 [Streptomyces goshikiensis]|uniref:hypothetical protein n=1 Tax=Streptomyces goshikiensis TaxID=1942 RepID=UPI0036BFFD50